MIMNQKKFKVRYYEMKINDKGEQYEDLLEAIVHATYFYIVTCDTAVFKNKTNDDASLVAAFSRFSSVEEVE